MSVYNRKLFKNSRPARDMLNQAAGIMASSAPLMQEVQRFRKGGQVLDEANQAAINQALAASPALAQRMAMLETGLGPLRDSPLATRMSMLEMGLGPLRDSVDSQTGDINLQGSEIEAIAEGLAGGRAPRPSEIITRPDRGLSGLIYSPEPALTTGGQNIRDLGTGILGAIDSVSGLGADLITGAYDATIGKLTDDSLNPAFAASVAAGEAELPSEIIAAMNQGTIPVPQNIAKAAITGDIDVPGLNLAILEGFASTPEGATVAEMQRSIFDRDPMPPAIPGYAEGGARPGQATISVERPVFVGPDGQYDGDDLGTAPTAPRAEPKGPDGQYDGDDLGTAPTAKEETKKTEEPETGAADGPLETDTIQPRTPQEISEVINKGTKEQQDSELKQLMKEFTQNAPKYEGLDKGLAIAKIGFAMAAGESPRAIQNIASALEDGADMFIKDKAKKDEFNRQLELSAMQYGLGEISKTKAQKRADDRNFRTVVANRDVTYKGRKYEKGEDIIVSMTDIMENNGQLPSGFENSEVYFKKEQAITDRLKLYREAEKAVAEAEREANKDLRGELVIKDEAQIKRQESYRKAADKFIQGEIGTKYLEEAVLMLSEDGQSITGIKGAGNEFMRRVAAAGGFEVGDKFNDREQFRKKVKLGFQNLIKSYFGGSQSANSISNFDVTSLADAYVDAALQDDGIFALTTKSDEILVGQLQTTMQQFRRDQDAALAQMQSMENMLAGRLLPGTVEIGSALSIIDPEKSRVQPYLTGRALPGGTSSRFRRLEAQEGDGGKPRYNMKG
jgi:hypothetical protein